MAFLFDALAISFHSHSAWELSLLQLRIEHLSSADDLVSIKHASSKDHIFEHRDWIKKRAQVDQSGLDLSAYRERLYPWLQFCASAIAQIEALPYRDIRLNHIMKHLELLNSYCETWQNGPFSPQTIALDISTESQATRQKYSQERTFLCPDNVWRFFNWHSKDKFINWRIHFYPWETERVIIIGYIGSHLPTMDFPT